MDKYLNNDLFHPRYLFHGSSILLNNLEPKQSHDLDNNPENEANAVFLTSSFIIASAYAFKEYGNLSVEYIPDENKINIEFDNINIDDEVEGYIYVVPYNEKYEHHGRSSQYKFFENITPIDTIKIKFGDFKKYYSINTKIR